PISLVVTEGDRAEHVVVIVEGPCHAVDKSAVPADVAETTREEWVSVWLCLEATRLISYVSEGSAL
ncbi:MAG: hypothetical protein M0008_07990, partial [Actinomycetota bacterium]|nr:hypothetical protein [Actinomycetota bacterium]